MSLKRAGALWALVLTVAIVIGFAGTAWASHRWGCWKYADYDINFFNGCTGSYYTWTQEEAKTDVNAWDPKTDIVLTQVTASGTTDHLNVYNGSYGFNGWLGIAEIMSYSGCIVRQGRARMNQSYLDNAAYGYTATNKKHVICQEIGHLFGLDHNRNKTNTCMNDTILTAPQPNKHDKTLINNIY